MFNSTDTPLKCCSNVAKMLKEFCLITATALTCVKNGSAVPLDSSCSFHCNGKSEDKVTSKRMATEVFLGGSCNPTTWRADTAIPTLQRLGITYYNPQVANWVPELVAQEYEAKESAKILFFVIDERTRNCAGVIEAAYLAASRIESLIVVMHSYKQGQSIFGEPISNQEYFELLNCQQILQYLLERQRIPIFENISAALNCTFKILRESVKLHELHNEDGIRTSRISFGQQGTDITKLREIFKSVDVSDTGTISLAEAFIVLQSSGKSNIPASDLRNVVNKIDSNGIVSKKPSRFNDPSEQYINFEQFCTIASEWSWRCSNYGITDENWTNNLIVNSEKKDLYIGVGGEDIVWLENGVIPLIESMGFSFHRRNISDYKAKLLPMELQKIRNSKIILLIISGNSRGLAAMTLAGHLIGLQTKLVLCVHSLPDKLIISNEMVSEHGIKDYNRGREYLIDIATRKGVPVFKSNADALQHVINLLRNSS